MENQVEIAVFLIDGKYKVINTTNVKGTVIIPSFFEENGREYPLIGISKNTFCGLKIDLLDFPEDSKVEYFEEESFKNSIIKKIKFPSSLKTLKKGWCKDLHGLTEIEIPANNPNFQYYNHDFLLGKSQEDSDIFDVLLYARYDIEEANIPPQVKIIDSYSFSYHKHLKSVKFSENSGPITIKDNAFMCSTIHTLCIPTLIDDIEGSFSEVRDLVNIEISPKNVNFSLFDKYLLKKSNPENQNFDILCFALRDIEYANIPSYIKVIGPCSFQFCTKLISVTFEPNSLLEEIKYNAFNFSFGPEKIVFPPLLKRVGRRALSIMLNLRVVTFLSQSIEFENYCFQFDNNLVLIAFPNAESINFGSHMINNNPDVKFYIKRNAIANIYDIKENIFYIDE